MHVIHVITFCVQKEINKHDNVIALVCVLTLEA